MKFLTIFAIALVPLFAQAKDIALKGPQKFEEVRLRNLDTSTTIDLRKAVFTVANSRNDNPSFLKGCKRGRQPINRYPFAVEDSRKTTILGGQFDGQVPLKSDWRHTYCNSAALRISDSASTRIAGQRMSRVWDAIRIGDRSQNFQLRQIWMTDVRDDCVENDYLMNGSVTNSLFDGCFSGISVAPQTLLSRQAELKIDGLIMRMSKFRYRGKMRHALPFKMKGDTSALNISNSIIAWSDAKPVGGKYAKFLWRSVKKCQNNQLLWLGDGPAPIIFDGAPSCFKVSVGQEAQRIWQKARQQWINCNAKARRDECP